jgi:hypothetical protein
MVCESASGDDVRVHAVMRQIALAAIIAAAVRYKNWKIYYEMSKSGATAWLEPLVKYHFTLVQNITRDPFEQFVTFRG